MFWKYIYFRIQLLFRILLVGKEGGIISLEITFSGVIYSDNSAIKITLSLR